MLREPESGTPRQVFQAQLDVVHQQILPIVDKNVTRCVEVAFTRGFTRGVRDDRPELERNGQPIGVHMHGCLNDSMIKCRLYDCILSLFRV